MACVYIYQFIIILVQNPPIYTHTGVSSGAKGLKGVRALRGYFGPPLEPKTESCFSPISSYLFIRRIAQV